MLSALIITVTGVIHVARAFFFLILSPSHPLDTGAVTYHPSSSEE